MALIHEGENDYLLPEGEDSVWVQVNNLAIFIQRHGEGIVVDVYPSRNAMCGALGSVLVGFEDGQ